MGCRLLPFQCGSTAWSFLLLYFNRLPDVAIELVDDACSLAKIGTNERWERLAYLKRRKVAIQIDMESLNVSSFTHCLPCSNDY